MVIENFDVEKFKRQPCGEDILKEYQIDGDKESQPEELKSQQKQKMEEVEDEKEEHHE